MSLQCKRHPHLLTNFHSGDNCVKYAALFRNLSGIYIVPVHSIYWTSVVFHDSFITLPVENLSLSDTEYNEAHCILWDRILFFYWIKINCGGTKFPTQYFQCSFGLNLVPISDA